MLKHHDMLFRDFPPIGKISSKVKRRNLKRTFTGGVRIAKGMYRTDDQQERYIRKSLKKRLP